MAEKDDKSQEYLSNYVTYLRAAVAVAIIKMKPEGADLEAFTRDLMRQYQRSNLTLREKYEDARNELQHLKQQMFLANSQVLPPRGGAAAALEDADSGLVLSLDQLGVDDKRANSSQSANNDLSLESGIYSQSRALSSEATLEGAAVDTAFSRRSCQAPASLSTTRPSLSPALVMTSAAVERCNRKQKSLMRHVSFLSRLQSLTQAQQNCDIDCNERVSLCWSAVVNVGDELRSNFCGNEHQLLSNQLFKHCLDSLLNATVILTEAESAAKSDGDVTGLIGKLIDDVRHESRLCSMAVQRRRLQLTRVLWKCPDAGTCALRVIVTAICATGDVMQRSDIADVTEECVAELENLYWLLEMLEQLLLDQLVAKVKTVPLSDIDEQRQRLENLFMAVTSQWGAVATYLWKIGGMMSELCGPDELCELDILFNSERVNIILDDMIANGYIVECSKSRVLSQVRLMDKVLQANS